MLSDIQENLGTGHHRERELGREETLVATRARVFLQVWTHLLLRNTMPNFSVAPVPVPLVIIFIELEAK